MHLRNDRIYKRTNRLCVRTNIEKISYKYYILFKMKLLACTLAFVVAVELNAGEIKKTPRSANIYVDPIAPPKDIGSLKIINGKEVVPHSIPSQVYIYGEGLSFTWYCGGTLIKPRFILTAAHCLDWAEKIEVTLGAHNISRREVSQIKIEGIRWKQHEKYLRKTIINDIGIIELAYPIYPTKSIDYAKLPSGSDFWQTFEGMTARVSGWGYVSSDRDETDVLREVNSTVIENNSCKEIFDIFENDEVCISGKGGKGACNGDSGGPLFIDGVQQGIVSYGARGCLYGYPTAFCRVAHFLQWISDNTHYN